MIVSQCQNARERLQTRLGRTWIVAMLGLMFSGPLAAMAPTLETSGEPAVVTPPAPTPPTPTDRAAALQACPERLKGACISFADIQSLQSYADTLDAAPRTTLLTRARDCVAARLGDEADKRNGDVRTLDALERDLAYLKLLVAGKDPRAFQLSIYGATTYSNLYRDPTKSAGFFSTSRPLVLLELSQVFTDNLRWESYGHIGLDTQTSVNATDLTGAITSSGNFTALAGLRWWLKQPNYAWILVGLNLGAGVVGVPSTASDGSGVPNDQFRSTFEAGVTLKQASGSIADSYSQFGYLKDPQFQQHPNRFVAKARLVYTPQTADGKDASPSGLGGFLEGLVNLGPGPDEVRITIGLKLNLDGVLKALFGTGTNSSQKSNQAPAPPKQPPAA